MQTLHVNGYDMAYLDVGKASATARRWSASRLAERLPDLVAGARSAHAQASRDRAVSLRHFFPDHWDGIGDTYSIAQHVDDVIAFIESSIRSRST